MTRLNVNGFSLVELLIAMAIALSIMMGVAGIYLFGFNSYLSMQNRSSLGQDSLLLVDFLRGELQGAGGGAVRAYMGLWVEDNCNARGPFLECGGSDRITVSAATIPLQQCAITSKLGATLYQMAWRSPGVCCMQPQAGEISYAGQSVMLTLNGFYSSRFAAAVDLGLCTLSIQPGQAAGGDVTGGTLDWSGGMATLMKVTTFYWTAANATLNRFTDANNDGVMSAGETAIVAVGVYDLQIALGYDFNPADGNILTTATGVNDEWLNNAPGVVESLGTGYFVPAPPPASLLMVEAGVILGVANPNGGAAVNSQRIFNGPLRGIAGWTMQAETTQLAPRNSFIFQ
ncbi:MAG: PilW family protein [Bdellovibrionales bacterium]